LIGLINNAAPLGEDCSSNKLMLTGIIKEKGLE